MNDHVHAYQIPRPDLDAFECECGDIDDAVMCDVCVVMFALSTGHISDAGGEPWCECPECDRRKKPGAPS